MYFFTLNHHNRVGVMLSTSRSFAKKTEKERKSEKKEKEKEQVRAEFEDLDEDEVKLRIKQQLDEQVAHLEQALKQVKSGRASPSMFDHLEITAYGEKIPFPDMCQTIVKGTNQLLVRIFDEQVKDDVIKAL